MPLSRNAFKKSKLGTFWNLKTQIGKNTIVKIKKNVPWLGDNWCHLCVSVYALGSILGDELDRRHLQDLEVTELGVGDVHADDVGGHVGNATGGQQLHERSLTRTIVTDHTVTAALHNRSWQRTRKELDHKTTDTAESRKELDHFKNEYRWSSSDLILARNL